MQLKFAPSKIESIQVGKLKPYEKNPRLHSPEQVSKISSSIAEFGWTLPILIDDENEIIAGHGRVLAAQKLGITDVPAIRIRHLSEDQVKAYRITDNQMVISGEWDQELLSGEITELDLAGFDLDLLGFSSEELANIIEVGDIFEPLIDEDDAPPEPSNPTTVPGDIWLLGKHRLMCGDSTSATDVKRLLAGAQPHLMVTDPPYGVNYDPDWRNRAERANGKSFGARAVGLVTNDDCSDWTKAYALFPGEVAYVWHAGLHAAEVEMGLCDSGFDVRSQIIWAKSHFAISRGHYHIQHEPCFYAVRKDGTGHWQGDRTQSTLWQIDKPMKSETGHSTQKPVECMKRPIENNSAKGDSVYEPFMGSGTTLIAAEQTGRKCFGMEISPAYVDVAVLRWQEYSGKIAMLEATGLSFNDVRNHGSIKATP